MYLPHRSSPQRQRRETLVHPRRVARSWRAHDRIHSPAARKQTIRLATNEASASGSATPGPDECNRPNSTRNISNGPRHRLHSPDHHGPRRRAHTPRSRRQAVAAAARSLCAPSAIPASITGRSGQRQAVACVVGRVSSDDRLGSVRRPGGRAGGPGQTARPLAGVAQCVSRSPLAAGSCARGARGQGARSRSVRTSAWRVLSSPVGVNVPRVLAIAVVDMSSPWRWPRVGHALSAHDRTTSWACGARLNRRPDRPK